MCSAAEVLETLVSGLVSQVPMLEVVQPQAGDCCKQYIRFSDSARLGFHCRKNWLISSVLQDASTLAEAEVQVRDSLD